MGLLEKFSEYEEKLISQMQKDDKGKSKQAIVIKLSIIVILVAALCGAFIFYYIPHYM